MPVKQTL